MKKSLANKRKEIWRQLGVWHEVGFQNLVDICTSKARFEELLKVIESNYISIWGSKKVRIQRFKMGTFWN